MVSIFPQNTAVEEVLPRFDVAIYVDVFFWGASIKAADNEMNDWGAWAFVQIFLRKLAEENRILLYQYRNIN